MTSVNLESVVEEVVVDFVSRDELFTALDVSNKVKETLPLARHREVRDVVRAVFSAGTMNDYARTPITVVLEDGTKAEALLYHPLSASWDLEKMYDDQKRAQKAARPTNTVTSVPVQVTAPVQTTPVVQAVVPQPPTVVQPPATTAKQLWDNIFNSNRLFPRF